MPCYYKLSDDFELASWVDNIYSIVKKNNREKVFLTQDEYIVLSMCDGTLDFSSCILPEKYIYIAKIFYQRNILSLFKDKVSNNIISIKKYAVPYIEKAQWSITGKCNYKCKHCYMSAPDGKYGELKTEQCFSIIKQLKDCGIDKIALTGGEPLIRKDFFKIVEKLKENNIEIYEIYTNGSLVNQKLLDNLNSIGVHPTFSISFDGKGHHDWLRGVNGAEELAIKAFRLLDKNGFRTTAEMCIYRSNLTTIRDTVQLLSSLNVNALKITPASPSGLWQKNGKDENLSFKEIYDYYLEYLPYYFKDGSPIDIMLGGFFACEKNTREYMIPSIKFDGTDNCKNIPVCMSAKQNLYIAADGKVLPCISLTGLSEQEKYPSIIEHNLKEILLSSNYKKFISMTIEDYLNNNQECQSCEYKYLCGGGCRAGALMSNGNYLKKDEATCFIFKEKYPQKIKNILIN